MSCLDGRFWKAPVNENENSRLVSAVPVFEWGVNPCYQNFIWQEKHLHLRREGAVLRASEGETQFLHPRQDLIPGRHPARDVLAHEARDVGLDAQLHQGIFGVLLVRQPQAGLLVQLPRQHQHFVRQVFFAGVAVGLFTRQDVPDGHQQFTGNSGNRFVFAAAFGQLLEALLPDLRTAYRPPGGFDERLT